jgi:hypothetical protein
MSYLWTDRTRSTDRDFTDNDLTDSDFTDKLKCSKNWSIIYCKKIFCQLSLCQWSHLSVKWPVSEVAVGEAIVGEEIIGEVTPFGHIIGHISESHTIFASIQLFLFIFYTYVIQPRFRQDLVNNNKSIFRINFLSLI